MSSSSEQSPHQPSQQPTDRLPAANSSPSAHMGSLNEEYTIDTPENVTFGFDVAGIGSRFIGALVDSLILGLLLFLVNVVLALAISLFAPDGSDFVTAVSDSDGVTWAAGVAIAIYALLNFILLWGYFIFFEMIWRGQTPGKRVAGIRVVRMDGNSISFLDNVIRNLIRIIDFLPFGYGVGLIVMFCNRHARRLGDFAAGTLVVREQKVERLEDFVSIPSMTTETNSLAGTGRANTGRVNTEDADAESATVGVQSLSAALSATMSAPSAASDPLRERFVNIRQISSLDFELIADTLQRHQSSQVSPDILRRLAVLMAAKLEMERPSNGEHQFLTDIAEAYRRYRR